VSTLRTAIAAALAPVAAAQDPGAASFEVPALWEYTAPRIAPEPREEEPSRAQKDPTVVFHGGRWHVFMTVKLPQRTAIEYCSFDAWENADASKRTLLRVSDSNYFAAPQVFFFGPQKRWYLVYQVGVPGADKMQVACSTSPDIADPAAWTPAAPILDGGADDPRQEGGLDYWIICDDARAYLFFTSLNGKLWRLWTDLKDFPKGFGHCEVALRGAFFEASHTYRLAGRGQYLTVVEEDGQRYYKAYVADRLDGEWRPIADTADKPFAGWKNIRPARGVAAWTDNVSHGELVRAGHDQTLTVDPKDLKFVFQGMLEREKAGVGYGRFAWRIGVLTPADPRRR
jgi:endo-1,4-beta-xylanase